jgi:DNA-binding MarR family transcriptional regulator
MTQLQLPDICRVRHGGVETSEAANARTQPSKSARQQAVLALLRERGTLTLREAATESGAQMNALSPRFSELHQRGLIERTADRRDSCWVWRLVEAQS